MPVSYVGTRASGWENTANLTITVNGAIPGNTLVMVVGAADGGLYPLTENTGQWTVAVNSSNPNSGRAMLYRVASGDSNDNVSVTFNGSDAQTYVIGEYGGLAVPHVVQGTPNAVYGQFSGTGGISIPLTPTDADPSGIFAMAQINQNSDFSSTEESIVLNPAGFNRDDGSGGDWGSGWASWNTSAQIGSGEHASASQVTPVWNGDGTGTAGWRGGGVFGLKQATAGPPPGEDMDAAVSGAASILATLSPVRLFNAAVSGAASVAATLSRVALLGASISGTAAVAGTLETFPQGAELAASVSGDAAVSATLEGFPVQPGAEMEAAVTGDASVLATLLASGGLGGALEGTASVTATLSPAPGFAAAVTGQASVTAALSGVPSLAAEVTAGATVDATLAAAFGLSGILSGNSIAILEAPSQFRPRFAMTIDLSPLFEENEFSFTTIWNDQVTFLSILTDFYAESIGGINIAGTDPILIAEHSLIPQVREGDSIKIEDWEWVVREVMPSNTGIVRLKLETVT